MDYFLVFVGVLLFLYFYPSIQEWYDDNNRPPKSQPIMQTPPGLLNVPPPSTALATKVLAPVANTALKDNAYMLSQTSKDDTADPMETYILDSIRQPVNLTDTNYSATDDRIRYINYEVDQQRLKNEIGNYYQMKDLL